MGVILEYNIQLVYVIIIAIISFIGGMLVALTFLSQSKEKTPVCKKDEEHEDVAEELERLYGKPKTVKVVEDVVTMEKVEDPLILDIEDEPDDIVKKIIDEEENHAAPSEPAVVVSKTGIVKGWKK